MSPNQGAAPRFPMRFSVCPRRSLNSVPTFILTSESQTPPAEFPRLAQLRTTPGPNSPNTTRQNGYHQGPRQARQGHPRYVQPMRERSVCVVSLANDLSQFSAALVREIARIARRASRRSRK